MGVRDFLRVSILCLLVNLSYEARILAIFPTPSVSHHIVYRTITEELARRGHHLTVVTTDPVAYEDPMMANMTQIDVKAVSYKIWNDFFNFIEMHKFYTSKVFLISYYDLILKITDVQLSQPEIKRLIGNDSNEHFDLCLVESHVPSIYAFKDRYNCSMVQVSSIGWGPENSITFGYPDHVLMYLHGFSDYNQENLSLIQKLDLIYSDVLFKLYYYGYYVPLYTKLIRKHFGPNTRPANELENDSDMILVNNHPLLHGIRPTLPTIIPIGSIHIKTPALLPENLQKVLDGAKKGVIYFNLGTNVKSRHLTESQRMMFINAFKEMPYTVIWKWESDDFPGKPSNIHISKWLPQQSILAHPNVKLFVTQGGKQSIEEAIHYKVPIVGIPFFGDQFFNCHKMLRKGAGLTLKFSTLTTKIFKNAVKEVINNPKYKEDIAKLRDLLYDQPETPLERAIWWIEYVIRHGGAKHLRSPAADATLFQYYMVDVLVFLAIAITVLIYVVRYTMRILSKYSIVFKSELLRKKVE